MASADVQSTDLIIDRDVGMITDGGVRLEATIYRRHGAPPRPVLLLRTPYGRDISPAAKLIDPEAGVRAGFVVILQDIRGRYGSEGVWRPYAVEAADGYAAVQWAAGLPFANGKVGMYGASNQGATTLAAAALRPPALRAIAPMLCWNDPEQGQTFRGGALEIGKLLRWTLMNMPDRLARRIADPREAKALIDALAKDLAALDMDGYWPLPLGQQPTLKAYDPHSEIFDYMRAADRGDLRHPIQAPHGARHDIPALWVCGWFDSFLGNMIREYETDRASGLQSEIVIGPWTHANRTRTVGDLDFGPAAEGVGEGPTSVQDTLLEWFTDTLIGGGRGGPPVQVFAMGPDVWRRQATFPDPEANSAVFYLTADGALSAEAGQIGLHSYTYDPDDPAPTIGGATVMGEPFTAGPRDQSALSKRADVLVFQTPPLDAALSLEGWVSVALWVESSAVCTDFVARLIDIHPDGRQIGVTDGIVRRNFTAGTGPQQLTLDLWATHYALAPGHRLGLQVTSSSFPRWSRNPNTGEPLMTAQRVQKAQQTVHVGQSTPSALRIGADRGPGRSATGA